MTLPRKNTRAITVGGNTYRYLLRHEPFYDAGGKEDYLHLTIEKTDAPRRRIRARFNAGGRYSILGDFLPSRIVTPGVVRQVIEHAAQAGWKPESAPQDFVLPYAERLMASEI